MDRDPSENVIDPEERVSPSTGSSETGESGDQRAREEQKLRKGERREAQDLDERKDNNNGVN